MTTESQINDYLKSLRTTCAVTNFALIVNIASPARVATALTNQRPFDSEDGLLYLNVARRLKALDDLVAPLPLDYSETEAIKSILASLSDKTLSISVHQEQPVVAAEPQYYVFLPGQRFYFVSRSPNCIGKIMINGDYQSRGAVRMSKDCADKLAAALTKSGHKALVVRSAVTNMDVAFDDFEALWGSEITA